MSQPSGAEHPQPQSGARPGGGDEGTLLQVMIMPKNIRHIKEGESILRYAYPPNSDLIENVHGFLHGACSSIERGLGKQYTDVVLLNRGDINLCAAYETISEDNEEGKKGESTELIVCCLWTIGEISGGAAVPKVSLHKDGKEIEVKAGRNHLDIAGVKVTKVSYSHDSKVLTSSDISELSVPATRSQAAAIQAMCNSIPNISHNISERLIPLPPSYWATLTSRLVRTLSLLWPSLLEATVMFAPDVTSFLDSFVKNVIPIVHSTEALPNSSLFSQDCRDDAKYVLHGLNNPTSITKMSDGSFVTSSNAPRYHPYGQLVMYRTHILSTTLPQKVSDSLLLYLTSLGLIGQFSKASYSSSEEESNFTDTVFIRGDGGEASRCLLIVYQKELLTLASILLPGVPECGLSQADTMCGMRKGANTLLASYGRTLLSRRPPPQALLPSEILRFWISCNRGASEAVGGSAASESHASRTFESLLPHLKVQLQKLSPYTVNIESPSKKHPLSYTVSGWHCPDHPKHMIVALWSNTDDVQPPSLPSLFCRIAAAVLV